MSIHSDQYSALDNRKSFQWLILRWCRLDREIWWSYSEWPQVSYVACRHQDVAQVIVDDGLQLLYRLLPSVLFISQSSNQLYDKTNQKVFYKQLITQLLFMLTYEKIKTILQSKSKFNCMIKLSTKNQIYAINISEIHTQPLTICL